MVAEPAAAGQTAAVLLSGGLDSAVLLAHEARARDVQPVYVSVGLAWETSELDTIARLLPRLNGPIRALARLELPMRDVYSPSHWAMTGMPPAYDTPDEDVYLLGRNVTLLSKAAVFCAQRRIGRLALGPLAGNPFPDATPAFFEAMARAMTLGLDWPIEIAAPLASMHKHEVIRLGASLGVPFELTVSCMNPIAGLHCGACSKCRERQDGFADAGVADPTTYAARPPRAPGARPDPP
jgi:7-cyano-7-deazaguanine synthase